MRIMAASCPEARNTTLFRLKQLRHRVRVSGIPNDDRFLFYWPLDRKVGIFDAARVTSIDLEPPAAGSDVWAVLAAGEGKRLIVSDSSVSLVAPRGVPRLP